MKQKQHSTEEIIRILRYADGDDTVDGSHPTDLGFKRQAEAFYPILSHLLTGQP